MARAGKMHVRDLVEREFSIDLHGVHRRVRGWRIRAVVRRERLHLFVAGVGGHRIGDPPSAGREREAGVEHACGQSVLERLVHVPDRIQLAFDVARVDRALVALETRGRHVTRVDRVERGFRGEHPGTHREMDALEPHRVHEPRCVAGDERAVHVDARHRVPAALGQRLRAVPHHLAALEQCGHERMLLEALEREVRIEHRVFVVEPRHEPDGEHAARHRVDERAAELFHPQRVAHRVDHAAGREPIDGHFPQLLDAERVELRQPALVEAELRDERLRQVAADAVAEDRRLRVDVDARLERALSAAVLVESAIAGAHADHARAVVEHLRCGKPREDVHARGFDLTGEPLHELVERDDVVAVVLERRRRDRKRHLAALGEEIHRVVMHRARERRALGFEIGNQILQRAWVEHRARQHVRARLACLVEHRDRERVAAARLLQLRQPERGRHAGGAAADDEDVEVECFAIGHT